MSDSPVSIPLSDIILDDEIYPRSSIDHKRVAMFAENMRDGFEFDPIHVQELDHEKGKYRILDGAHRWQAHKKRLKGFRLWAKGKAKGPKSL